MKRAIATLAAVITLVSGSSAAFGGNDKSKIEKLIRSYESSLIKGDTDSIVKAYASDGIFMPQHAPAQVGADAIKSAYEGVFKEIKLDIKFDIHEVEVMGNTAWARTSSSGKTKILAPDVTVDEGNNEIFIFKKVKSVWKIHRYIFTTTVPRQK